MSQVTISEVIIHDNVAPFTAPFRFEVCYESLAALEEDLEWKLVYVGSAEDVTCDQELESVFVGPVVPGTFRFVLEADPPNVDKIPKEDLLGATALFLSGCYRDEEFVRVGYYVNNEYPGQEQPQPSRAGEQAQASPGQEDSQPQPQAQVLPDKFEASQIIRSILSDEPRVTKFPIKWDATSSRPQEPSPLPEVMSSATEVEQGSVMDPLPAQAPALQSSV